MNGWVQTPVGTEPEKWTTWTGCRRVLAIARTVADTQRLMDPVATLARDPRVQVVFTVAPRAAFGAGVERILAGIDAAVIPWEQALHTRFDLALAASVGRDLDLVRAPVALFAHGVGFNKYVPVSPARRPDASRGTYGLGRDGLVRGGTLVAARVALAHSDEERRLAAACPEAADAARVVGDAAADRILASLDRRDWCRDQLGVGPDDRLVVAASTWGRASLLGARSRVLWRLVAEAHRQGCRVALLVHPNVLAAHGPWQVREWLSPWTDAGLLAVPTEAEWPSVLAAADAVVGDHGSTTVYAALTGRPMALATDGHRDVDPASPMGEALRSVPPADEGAPLLGQLLREVTDGEARALASIASRVTSHPRRFAHRVRPVLYDLLGLREPATEPAVRPLRPLGLDIPGGRS
ncbi:hypothetical protein [Nocardiopsis sp. FIRDI 009]|uniref:hypothetical protein n=1 Tax=Nocardiopsis sp. FIRDI 009 TaxID=714197 RepID=UPI000E28848D|nr:hypothetical protein [Nocardiopsis sp. FIRDI 009]